MSSDQQKLEFLDALRRHEAESVLSRLKPGLRLLELGGGAGWQARLLSEHGAQVTAIDVAESHYLEQAVFLVTIYDGHHIPGADGEFEVIFSSNVLEHIPHIDEMLLETKRVLRAEGVAWHILPTASWRFWSTWTHLLSVWGQAGHCVREGASSASARPGDGLLRRGMRGVARGSLHLMGNLWPRRHGELGNLCTEFWLFSRFRWRKKFREQGWIVMEDHPLELFYTGSSLLGSWLPIPWRRRLSTILGSACRLYVLSPAKARTRELPTREAHSSELA